MKAITNPHARQTKGKPAPTGQGLNPRQGQALNLPKIRNNQARQPH